MAKQSLKEKLKKRREDIKKKQSGNVFFPKEGTTRFRVLPTGDEDWGVEVTYFYLGNDIKGVYSPATFGKPCPIMEHYQELKAQGDEANTDLKKTMVPRKKYLIPVAIFEADSKKVDEGNSNRLMQLPQRIYVQMVDMFLDSDFTEFNDKKEGYDLKLKREGTKLTNTVYSLTNLPPSPVPIGYEKDVDPEEMAKDIIESYDDLEDKLAEFLSAFVDTSEDDKKDTSEDDAPKNKKRKRRNTDA